MKTYRGSHSRSAVGTCIQADTAMYTGPFSFGTKLAYKWKRFWI